MVSGPRRRPHGARANVLLSWALVVAFCAPASAVPTNTPSLFARDSSSCAAGYNTCPGFSFPSNFCCPTGSSCIALAGNTTLLCCPDGQDCSLIQPITCTLQQQNATLDPTAPIKTTVLNGSLTRCGGTTTCCPYGYSCNASGMCAKLANQDFMPAASSSASASASPTTPASTTASSSSDGTAAAAASSSATSSAGTDATSSHGSSTAAIAGAVIGTAAAGVILACIAMVCIRRRKQAKKDEHDKRAGSGSPASKSTTSSFGNIISAPIVPEGSTLRSDFGRRNHDIVTQFPGPDYAQERRARVEDANEDDGPNPFRTPPSRIPPIRTMRDSGNKAWGSPFDDNAHPQVQTQSRPAVRATNIIDYYSDDNRNTPERLGTLRPPSTHLRPRTPTNNREPSSVSINVFADPEISRPSTPGSHKLGLSPPSPDQRRMSHLTTFTSLMDQADLGNVAHGSPFVPGSAYSGSPGRRK
jgi:hypothetical protein